MDTWGHPQREQISTGCPTTSRSSPSRLIRHRDRVRSIPVRPDARAAIALESYFSVSQTLMQLTTRKTHALHKHARRTIRITAPRRRGPSSPTQRNVAHATTIERHTRNQINACQPLRGMHTRKTPPQQQHATQAAHHRPSLCIHSSQLPGCPVVAQRSEIRSASLFLAP